MTAPPRTWIVDGDWPTGTLAPDAPPAAAKVAVAASIVNNAVAQSSFEAVAAGAGVDRDALEQFLAGRQWPTLDLLAELEMFLGRSLW